MKLKEAISLKSTLTLEVESLQMAVKKLDDISNSETRGCVMVLKAMLSEREAKLSKLTNAIDSVDIEIGV